jgi:hypothetical protein
LTPGPSRGTDLVDETLSPSSGTSGDSNGSVTNAMESLTTDSGAAETAMEVDEAAATSASAKAKPNLALHQQVPISTEKVSGQIFIADYVPRRKCHVKTADFVKFFRQLYTKKFLGL